MDPEITSFQGLLKGCVTYFSRAKAGVEESDFTPWLADQKNLAILGNALGMPLEFVAREEAVGPYSADILCRDSNDGTQVVVENQLESTDHDHLGQAADLCCPSGRASGCHYFDLLHADRHDVEEEHEFSDEMEWYNPTGAQQRKIYWRLPTDFGDRDQRTDQYRWLLERVEALHRVLAPRVKALPVPE